MAVVVLVAPVTAAAKLAPISGQLSKRGYRVLALAANGKVTSVYAGTGRFSLRPPAGRVTLQLRAPDGVYAGPIVVAVEQRGKRVIEGVKAGAKLGKIEIFVSKGYAKVKRNPAKKWIDRTGWARAKTGVPIGNGRNFGFVRSKVPRVHPPGDLDADGVPDVLDIDVNGNLILNDYDRSPAHNAHASAAQVGGAFPDGSRIRLGTGLAQPFYGSVNWAVNVDGGSTADDIAAVQRANGNLYVLWTGLDPGSGELNCGVLIYCRAGGTGRLLDEANPSANGKPFPECCDPNHNGFGSLTGINVGGGGPDGSIFRMSLAYGTTTDQIRPGDLLIEKGTINRIPQESAATLGFVFATYPVIAGYNDEQGDTGTFSYPPSEACRAAPGSCAAPVRAGSDGHVVLRLSFWRPQRPRIEGEPGAGPWMDVGHLAYAVGVSKPTGGEGWCPRSTYTPPDPNMTPLSTSVALPLSVPTDAVLIDGSDDQPSSPANTFTNTVDLTRCYAALGLAPQTGMAVKVYAAPIRGSEANAFAVSEAQFIRQQP